MNEFYQYLYFFHIPCRKHVSLKDYTTLHIGGYADLLIEPRHSNELIQTLEICHKKHIPYYILGNGSNVLALDEGYKGAVIVLSTHMKYITQMNANHIKAECGLSLSQLCFYCLHKELTGLEFACGIPGTVGGAVFMNAGAYGGEMSFVVESVTFIDYDLQVKTLMKDELLFDYRQSYFSLNGGVIVDVTFQLRKGQFSQIENKMHDLIKKRWQNQPMDQYSAGSTFKRPKDQYASLLIKKSGLEGYRKGDACVSCKHTGFLINLKEASSDDFLSLIDIVKKKVKQDSGYELECEIKILKDDTVEK